MSDLEPTSTARSESISVRALAQLVSGQKNPDSNSLQKASTFLDSLKVLDLKTYELRITADNLCAKVATEIGEDKLSALIGEINHETQEVFTILDSSLKRGTPIPHEAVTGWAIGRVSKRPTHQDINAETWGSLFSIQTCIQEINLSQTKPA